MFIPDTRVNVRLGSQKLKIALRSMEAYSDTKLYRMGKIFDGRLVIPFMGIADQDEESPSPTEEATYVSPSLRGYLIHDIAMQNFSISWHSFYNYTTHLNYAGRGLELSDLKVFDGKLLAADDKTGVIFRLTKNLAIPKVIQADGNGFDNKSMCVREYLIKHLKAFKTEWMTIKNEELYVGGYGKEYTDPKGSYLNDKPLWIKVVDRFGQLKHVYWGRQFKAIRGFLGINFPGYMIHESCQWSDIHQRWFFLPRRVSWEPYDEKMDQYRGSNYLITADETFTKFSYVRIGTVHPTRGFSAFQFIPNSNDQIIVAFKSEEIEGWPLASYIMVFDIYGKVFIDETKVPADLKLEGLEFFDWKLSE
ncbi:hypothetical protein M3Y94_00290200 [Aphelenchoides besseyi]|nr:hypothetical protein M3Y94_00290200 [Aphelenchoides besseyi]KAI6235910.1 hypothetical protein M3Y95_00101500 [Aphelenchoides besseyi]